MPAHPGDAPKRRRFRLSFRISLVLVALFTIAVTAAAVHVPWLYISRDNVNDMARQLSGEIVRGINREIDNLFRATIAAQQTMLEMLESGAVSIDDKEQRDAMLFSFLQANPHFSWVTYGRPDGDFFGAQRRGDGAYRIADSEWDPETETALRREDYYAFDGSGVHYTQTKYETNDFYSPARKWYIRALEQPGRPVWTEVYVFASSRKPGVDAAVTFAPGEQLDGVLGISIELESISRYLRDLVVGKTGTAFIVSRSGELIAFRDPQEVTYPQQAAGSSTLTLRPLEAATAPMLQQARAALPGIGVPLDRLRETRMTMHRDEKTGARYFVSFAPSSYADWIVGTVIPEGDFTARIDANARRLLLAVALAVLLAGLASVLVARFLFIAPLTKMIDQAKHLERFDLAAVQPVPSRITELDSLSGALQQMSVGLASFRKYVPADLVQTLIAQGMKAELSGERRTVSIMFMDLTGFTKLTERHGHRLLPQLGTYLEDMTGVLGRHRATIDKFIGDAIMALWGAPLHDEDHAVHAIRAALECLAAMERRREEWAREGKPALTARIGINSGRVVVGNIGSPDRLAYTAIGDAVNLASRLENLNKVYGTELLIGQATYDLARFDIVARRLDHVAVKGRDEPVDVYEVFAMIDDEGAQEKYAWIATYERGIALFGEQDWEGAIACFEEVIRARGEDQPSVLFIDRCRRRMGAFPAAAKGAAGKG